MGDNMVHWYAVVLLVGWFCSLQCGSFIQKKECERADGPVHLSKVYYLLCIFVTACAMFVILMHNYFFDN
jgi:prolipoprotein diacylglyceryltransferase